MSISVTQNHSISRKTWLAIPIVVVISLCMYIVLHSQSEVTYDILIHDPKFTATFVEDTQPPGSEDYDQLELEVNNFFEIEK